jgi:hypothetical protein
MNSIQNLFELNHWGNCNKKTELKGPWYKIFYLKFFSIYTSSKSGPQIEYLFNLGVNFMIRTTIFSRSEGYKIPAEIDYVICSETLETFISVRRL